MSETPRQRRWRLLDDQTPSSLLAAALAAPSGARLLKESPRRLLCRVEGKGTTGVVKIHRRRGVLDRMAPWLGLDPATREAKALSQALAAGLPVPRPLALCTRLPGGESRLLLEDLGPLAESCGLPDRKGSSAPPGMGTLVADLHRNGFDHRDLHRGNLARGARGNHILDFQAVTRRHPPLAARRRLANLTTLWLSCRDRVGARPALRFLQEYLRALPWPGNPRRATLARDIDRATVLLRARSWRRREDRPFRQCSEFTITSRPDFLFIRARYASSPDLGEIRAAMADPGARILRRGRRGFVMRSRGLIIKERDRSHARRLWLNHYRLRQRGLARAEALALLIEGGWGVVVVRDLGPLPHLDQALRQAKSPGERQGILAALLQTVEALHATGLSNRDLKAPNLLVRPAPLQVIPVDLDGVDLLGWFPQRRRDRDLARLARALAEAGVPPPAGMG